MTRKICTCKSVENCTNTLHWSCEQFCQHELSYLGCGRVRGCLDQRILAIVFATQVTTMMLCPPEVHMLLRKRFFSKKQSREICQIRASSTRLERDPPLARAKQESDTGYASGRTSLRIGKKLLCSSI